MSHTNSPSSHEIYTTFQGDQREVIKDLLERIERLDSRVLELESMKNSKGEIDW